MTIVEFKNKYPQHAHLDGNELWNMMEHEYIIAHPFNFRNKIFDWKGNEIIEGDIIRIVNLDDGRCGREHRVLCENGVLCYDAGSFGGFSFKKSLDSIFSFNSRRILVIKGKSDDEKEYSIYATDQNYFRSDIQ